MCRGDGATPLENLAIAPNLFGRAGRQARESYRAAITSKIPGISFKVAR